MTPIQAIESLRALPMTEAAIAAAVGVRQSTINKIKSGAMKPNWELGDQLVNLARERVSPTPSARLGKRRAGKEA